MATQVHDETVEEMTVEEGRTAFNALTRDALGLTGDQFLVALDAGAYDDTEDEQVIRLRMLAPFGR